MSMYLLGAAVATAIAAVWDLRTGRIPNWLTLGGIVAGVGAHLVHGFSAGGWAAAASGALFSLAGAATCSVAPLLLYWKNGMGGGDVKLFAALGALCHPMLGIECQVYSLLLAAVFAPAQLAYRGRLLAVLGGSLAMIVNPFLRPERRRAMPPEVLTWFRLGPAIFCGTVLTLLVHGGEGIALPF